MSLSTKQKQELKAKAHNLKPVVCISYNGLTENVKKELDSALDTHELIKIRIRNPEREIRQELFIEACEATHAEAIKLIGSIGIIYRQKDALKK